MSKSQGKVDRSSRVVSIGRRDAIDFDGEEVDDGREGDGAIFGANEWSRIVGGLDSTPRL